MENNIVNWITGRSDLKQVPLEELKAIVHQYPYFTLAQLLLTVKMKREDDPEYPQQLQKTALNFQNPQWLHFQLESLDLELNKNNVSVETKEDIAIEEPIIVASDIEEEIPNETSEEEISFEKEPQSIADLLKENVFVEEEKVYEQIIPFEENTISENEIVEANTEDLETIPESLHEIPAEEIQIEPSEESPQEESAEGNIQEAESDIVNTEEEEIEDSTKEEIAISQKSETDIQEVTESVLQEEESDKEVQEQDNIKVSETQTEDPIEEITANTEEETAEESVADSDLVDLETSEAKNIETENPTPIDKTEDENEGSSRLSALLEAQASAFKSNETPKEELSFDQPALLPTKDYFASIGVTMDNASNTDFGQKVKRFSDWLKQMKKVERADIDKQSDPNEEKIISQKAHDSNKPSSIVTETMAEVLIQQGKNIEAIETLEKLSLLKPEKSAYFASLITNLKNNI